MIRRDKKEDIAEQYRQGDVLLIAADLPEQAVQQPRTERIVLAEGEVTGHAHALEQSPAAALFLKQERRFLRISAGTMLKHEEHESINLPPRTFEVRRQRTWSVLKDVSQRVAD